MDVKNMLFAAFKGAPTDSYWISKVNDSTDVTVNNTEIDSAGDIYTVGFYGGTTAATMKGFLIKLSGTTGAKVWERTFNSSNSFDNINGIYIDSSDNIYISSGDQINLYTYSSAGTLLNELHMNIASSYIRIWAITGDSGGNLILAGTCYVNGNTYAHYAGKFTSSLTQVWAKYYPISTSDDIAYGCITDSSDAVYIIGTRNQGASGYYPILWKLTSAGTYVWGRDFNALQYSRGFSFTKNVTGEIYGTSIAMSASGQINSFNVDTAATTGTLSKRTTLYISGLPRSDRIGFVFDSLGNYYFAFDALAIYKFNSSNVLEWKQFISISGKSIKAIDLKINALGSLIATVQYYAGTAGSYRIMVFKVPSTSIKAGTYTIDGLSVVISNTHTGYSTSYAATANSANNGNGNGNVTQAAFTTATTVATTGTLTPVIKTIP